MEEQSDQPKVRKKLTQSKIVLLAMAAVALALVIWLAWFRPAAPDANSFAECEAAGYPVQARFPEVCVTPEGRSFQKPDQLQPDPLVQ